MEGEKSSWELKLRMQKKVKRKWQEMKHKLQPVLRVTRRSSVPCYEVWTLFGEHDG